MIERATPIRIAIDGDTMTINGVKPSTEEEKNIRDRWKEEKDLWDERKKDERKIPNQS